MKVFIVFAHPDRRSFNGSLLKETIGQFEADGHEVRVTDLYGQKWKAQIDEDDFPITHKKGERLHIGSASGEAFVNKELTKDVMEEIEKLLWADLVIFQFPMWWFGMPAILKGWVERVLVCHFGYGVGEFTPTHYGDRFGEGTLEGKKAMLIVTAGGRKDHYSSRGILGPIDHLLFPINHGVFFCTGMTPLPAFVTYGTDSATEEVFESYANELKCLLKNIGSIKPINYRKQNSGDYDIPSLILREGLERPGETGYDIHLIKD
ncbi:hypothetical protein NCAS_0H02020 [Naumovozyma castellii]|uniref:Flavodoxin-like fold domain-containing protein n=1 Tax=Naumovozyma castellii TaxID=27288 RepID=G0VJ33_NAUCA|nr:hypothetical protein NCAS_0H02020 [Naumovozyma castellii CBS 4309]CCC71512.1 hypothetical protein NCAS_0H02020 [Naumovozyma castellii CBS 4309]